MHKNINIQAIVNIATKAGEEVMKIYKKDFLIAFKNNKSPLTKADLASNKIICTALTRLYPNIPILSEENQEVPYEERKKWTYFWLIDPIDGTKEFIKENDEFTINIALIKNDTPILGVVYAPALNEMYYAKVDEGAFKNRQRLPLHTNPKPKEKLKVVVSKSHLSEETQDFIDKLDTKNIEQISKGSSLKLCMVAEGKADIYPRLAPTMEWDTAAAHAIVLEAKKNVLIFDTIESLIYNKKNLLNPWFVVI